MIEILLASEPLRPALLGPEQLLAGEPKLFAAVIGGHIFTGLFAIWLFAKEQWGQSPRAA